MEIRFARTIQNVYPSIGFSRIKGFTIENIPNFNERPKQLGLVVGYSNFRFFYKNTPVKACSQLTNITPSIFVNQFIYNQLKIERSFSILKICPLIFQNADISFFSLSFYSATFYLNKKLSFENIDSILGHYLNSFKDLFSVVIAGDIESIQLDIFRHFTNLKFLAFDGQNIRNLIHKIGIEWIKSLN
ncbi:unnamed protein product, partial [Brachionus calyciflorus]